MCSYGDSHFDVSESFWGQGEVSTGRGQKSPIFHEKKWGLKNRVFVQPIITKLSSTHEA